jgi:cobalamin biosynthesis protein CobT
MEPSHEDTPALEAEGVESLEDTQQDALEAPEAESEGLTDVNALQRELAKTRREAASYRKRAKELDEAVEAQRLAEMSEVERLREELAKATELLDAERTTARETRLSAEIQSAATKLGAVDPDAVERLLDRDQLVSEDGTPEGVDDAVRSLLDEKPYLRKRQGGVTGTYEAGSATPEAGSRLSQSYLDSLSPEQVAELWKTRPADIIKALQG